MSEQEVFDALKYRIEVDDTCGTRRYYNAAGQKHREHGPAVIWSDGSKFWYQNGLPHRMDGPAIELSDGIKEWYINGVEMSEDDFNQAVKTL